jgi:PAS domain S-box-containing protein
MANNHDQLFNLIKRIPQALILSDGRGCVRFLNKQAEKLLGTSTDKARGIPYFELVHDISEKGVSIQQYLNLLESGRTSEMDIKFKPALNSKIVLAGKMIPVHSADHNWLITAVYEKQTLAD